MINRAQKFDKMVWDPTVASRQAERREHSGRPHVGARGPRRREENLFVVRDREGVMRSMLPAASTSLISGMMREAGVLRSMYAVPMAAPRQGAAQQHVQRVIDMDDMVVRNYHITHDYHDISNGMRKLLGSDDANWCTMAQWASRQAGQSIRQEDLPIANEWARDLHDLLGDATDWATSTIAKSVGRGNRKVYMELAPVFVRFLTTFQGLAAPDQNKLDTFLQHLRPGAVEDGGQDLLKQAFTNYYKAKFATTPKAKSELILLANIQIGLHEQNRLQEDIESSIPLGTRTVVTELLSTLKLPHRNLQLGEDLPSRFRMFPKDLERIENPELLAVLDTWDKTPNSTRGTGADDWANLGERMHYIADFFRSYQQDQVLFTEPLNTAERNQLQSRLADHLH